MKHDAAVVVLMIEGYKGVHPSFSKELRSRGYQTHTVSNGSAGLKKLESLHPNVVVVDAASLGTSGIRICQSLRKAYDELPIILIVEKDVDISENVDANLVLHLPFTVQKLINRMCAYRTTADRFVMEAGPIELNTQTHLVTCQGKQSKLTPCLVTLLKVLIENKGKVIERKPLFSEVWETDYTDDTRTLDTHISWLRQAIEENPHSPQLIKTVRGVGYILDI